MSDDRPAESYADQMGRHGGATAAELVEVARGGDVEAAKTILRIARHHLRPGGRWAKAASENVQPIVEFLDGALAEAMRTEDASAALGLVRRPGGQRDRDARRKDELITRKVHSLVMSGRSKTAAVEAVAGRRAGKAGGDPSATWRALRRAGKLFWRALDWQVATCIESLVEEGASLDDAVQQLASERGYAESAVRACLDAPP